MLTNEVGIVKNAVIYARYSSDKQNEQSIAGQVEVCSEWAKNNNVNIVEVYHDEALTGKTDKRPAFQQMIKDAKSGRFSYILVYKLDRFARNRYDSATYKAQLKKHDVKVISVMENIADGPEGIILESVLEGMAEYYSANLSQNVVRGMRQRAEEAKFMGGMVPLGYVIDEEKNYVVDEGSAAIVRKIFERYVAGESVKSICDELNAAGCRTTTKKKFTINSLRHIIKNEKYIGRYKYFDLVLDDAVPKIVDELVFQRAQQRMESHRRAPALGRSDANFHLVGKLFCGHCESNMVGDSGTSCTGSTYYYYSCGNRKRFRQCTKKSVKKEWIEEKVVDMTVRSALTDENIRYIAEEVYKLNKMDREDKSELAQLKSQLRDTQKSIDNIMNAIEQGIITPTTKERLFEAEERRSELLSTIARTEIKNPKLTVEQIEFFLYDVRDRIYNADDRADVIIRTFVNAVYLYDDKITVTFNLREGETLKKVTQSTLDEFDISETGFTITILSELLLFAITTKLRSS